ncbi:aconitase X catalytic domain-containing protein [Steroidobacter sp.]|uniref:aconitase X catalytic domain-containing protein n=1 Tax=Steroidobacter sp. TaxID=1978227 RepID=UPI001A4EF8E4|nr:aconitase X catalytic domain-containing protein [Steroidobacter sp.]MBL8268881.1 aconitase X catalytic domain-containing protein [Steroidobacter sp.]
MKLSERDRDMLAGAAGEGTALAMRILVGAAEALGADTLIDIESAHIDGCLYHGDSGTLFAEKLVETQAKVRVPTTLNVGALDLLHGLRTRLPADSREMAHRMMTAYIALGCQPTWTCAPYQAGHRPSLGSDVAWGESNAVAFCNSVLGARTNRYGDFLDICSAITGRAPRTGLHIPENRRATVLIDASQLPREFLADDIAHPILGAWLGKTVGAAIAAFQGLGQPSEDQLKALGAAAASTGAVGLFHVIGVTPEAPTVATAFGEREPVEIIRLTAVMLTDARSSLSTVQVAVNDPIQAVAIGSPHLSAQELRNLAAALGTRHCQVPLYACTSRSSLSAVTPDGIAQRLLDSGVVLIADTCIVVTPILPEKAGILVTNSGKFAHYAPGNTGYDVVFASLQDCVDSAVSGRLSLREAS